MSTRSSKRQQARQLAMEALAEKMERARKVEAATQEAFLAQAELDAVRSRFATALQELDTLGETQAWIRETFELSAADLRALLTLDAETDEEDDLDDTEEEEQPQGDTDSVDDSDRDDETTTFEPSHHADATASPLGGSEELA